MARFDFIKAFYKATHNRDTFVADLDALLGSRPRGIFATSIPFSTELRPEIDFPGLVSKSRKVRLLDAYDGVQLYELRYTFKWDGDKQSSKGKFFVYGHPTYPHVFVAVTIEHPDFVRRGLLRLLTTQFPRIVIGFVPQARLKRLLGEFKASHDFSQLIITRAAQRLRLPEEGVHRRVMPVMSWPEMALEEALDWLVEHNGWFHSVQFDAKRDGHTVTRASITRDGVIRCDYLYEKVFQSFVLPVCKIHHENYNLFSRRGRRDTPSLGVRPLAITFDQGQFDDVAEDQTLIHALRSMPTASVSVLHGNPYIHLSTADYFDGSVFDVWVVDSRELVIVPQMYASVGAIKRLVNHIFDTYAEGEVKDYVPGAV